MTTEIVKVQRPLAFAGFARTETPGWLIYTNDPQQPRMQAQAPTPEMVAALGDDPKGYFEAVWNGSQWEVGRRIEAKLW